MMIQSLRQKWKQYLKKWSLWSPFVSLWLGSCFGDFSGFSYFFGEFSGCFAGFGQLFWGFQRFQLLFPWPFPAVSLVLGSCFRNFSSFSYFFQEFFLLFGWIGELFQKFYGLQLPKACLLSTYGYCTLCQFSPTQ